MKLTLSTGTLVDDANLEAHNEVHNVAMVRSVNMAPFGVPVLPEVYMIIASRSSLPLVYPGSCGIARRRR